MDARDGTVVPARSPWMVALDWLFFPRKTEDIVATFAPMSDPRTPRARVRAVHAEHPGCATLVLEPNRAWKGHARAGQFVAVTVEVDGHKRTRCFTISSAPRERGTFEITVQSQPGGLVTPRMVEPSFVGSIVELSQPQGSFVLAPEPAPHTLFITGGSGITPALSILRSMRGTGLRATLVHFARSPERAIALDELTAMEHVDVHAFFTDERPVTVSEALLRERVPALEATPAYACGPEGLLRELEAIYRGIDALDRLHTERFALAPARAPSGADATVTFTRSGVRGRGEKTLLAIAEEARAPARSGCRMGICNTCLCDKTAGTTLDLRTNTLSSEPGPIALCSSVAVTDVEIDL